MRYALLVPVLLGLGGLLGCSNSAKPSGPDAGLSDGEKARRGEEERAKERVRNMERVLAADKGTSTGVKTVAEIVSRMRTISLAGCPTEFSSAYLAHVHAWEDMAAVERDAIAFDANFNSKGALLEAFVRGMMLDPFGKAKEGTAELKRLRANYQQAGTKIRESYHRVEEVAVAAGAALQPKK